MKDQIKVVALGCLAEILIGSAKVVKGPVINACLRTTAQLIRWAIDAQQQQLRLSGEGVKLPMHDRSAN